MNQKEAKEYGRDQGYNAGLYGTEDIDPNDYSTKEDYEDALMEEAFESEIHSRQFSPWEHIAKEINSAKPDWRVDGLWDAYEEGVELGIKEAIRPLLKKW